MEIILLLGNDPSNFANANNRVSNLQRQGKDARIIDFAEMVAQRTGGQPDENAIANLLKETLAEQPEMGAQQREHTLMFIGHQGDNPDEAAISFRDTGTGARVDVTPACLAEGLSDCSAALSRIRLFSCRGAEFAVQLSTVVPGVEMVGYEWDMAYSHDLNDKGFFSLYGMHKAEDPGGKDWMTDGKNVELRARYDGQQITLGGLAGEPQTFDSSRLELDGQGQERDVRQQQFHPFTKQDYSSIGHAYLENFKSENSKSEDPKNEDLKRKNPGPLEASSQAVSSQSAGSASMSTGSSGTQQTQNPTAVSESDTAEPPARKRTTARRVFGVTKEESRTPENPIPQPPASLQALTDAAPDLQQSSGSSALPSLPSKSFPS